MQTSASNYLHASALPVLLLGVLGACAPAASRAPAQSPTPATTVAGRHDNLDATLWMQRSVEYAATTRGLFELAKLRLQTALVDEDWTAAPAEQTNPTAVSKLAIIVDADETVIDNSPYQARGILYDREYSAETWYAWSREIGAAAVPGARELLDYAKSKGVEVFYVTNRETPVREATIENLARLGFPNADADHVLTRCLRENDAACPDPQWASSAKGTRRAHVARTHRILLLLGDNLGDFLDIPPEQSSPGCRAQMYRDHLAYWGERWIMLPNPVYGSWEDALRGNERGALLTAYPQDCRQSGDGSCAGTVQTAQSQCTIQQQQ